LSYSRATKALSSVLLLTTATLRKALIMIAYKIEMNLYCAARFLLPEIMTHPYLFHYIPMELHSHHTTALPRRRIICRGHFKRSSAALKMKGLPSLLIFYCLLHFQNQVVMHNSGFFACDKSSPPCLQCCQERSQAMLY